MTTSFGEQVKFVETSEHRRRESYPIQSASDKVIRVKSTLQGPQEERSSIIFRGMREEIEIMQVPITHG